MRYASRRVRRLEIEPLEARACPSITVQIDYSLDTQGFFSPPLRRQLLQAAADSLAAHFTDSLQAVTPGGGNTWSITFPHPATGAQQSVANPIVPANTILVYAGGRPDLGGGTVGEGGPGGFSASGTQAFLDLAQARGQAGALGPSSSRSDIGLWGGAITFDSDLGWHFGFSTVGLDFNETDFLSVAIHELAHLLGFGTAPAWFNRVQNGLFTGPLATEAFDGAGSPPVSGGHWSGTITDGGQQPAMSPSLQDGTRKLFTGLDRAALGDTGWQLRTDSDATLATAIETGVGTTTAGFTTTTPTLENAVDVDLYRFHGTAGQGIEATTTARAGSGTVNTYLRLFNAAGTELINNDDGGTPAGYSRLTFLIPSTGTYYIGVSSFPNTAYLPTEAFARGLAGPTGGYNLTVAQTSPAQLATFAFSASGYFITEGGTLEIPVQRSGIVLSPMTVQYALTVPATLRLKEQATLDRDVQAPLSGGLQFGLGESEKRITLGILEDQLVEADTEFFTINLFNQAAGAAWARRRRPASG
jgi:hypothetical protein